MADSVWLALCEISVEPGDLPSGKTKAFARIATWASSQEALWEKVSGYLESFKWQLLSIETAHPIHEDQGLDAETAQMIRRTRESTKAIIIGPFFSYRES
jgi:hypothetical protein